MALYQLLILLLGIIHVTDCTKCVEFPLRVPGMQCYCPEEVRGWERSCYVKPSKDDPIYAELKLFYSITYKETRKSLKLDCDYNKNINYTDDLFVKVNDTIIEEFMFYNCPVPHDVSLKNMLRFFNITVLSISSVGIQRNVALNSSFLNGLNNLIKLQFEGGIHSISKDIFTNFTKLKWIIIEKNDVNSLPKELFRSLTGLLALSISKNNLSTVPETLFAGLSKLKRLQMYSNKISALPAKSFQGLHMLKTLDLNSNSLKELPSEIFFDLPNLEQLALGGNNLITLPPEIFKSNAKLDILKLQGNQFVTLPGDLLSGLGNLTKLMMFDCNMTHFENNFFYNAEKLKDLDLQNNRLKTILPLLLSRNKNLMKIKLIRNDLKNLTYDMLKGLSNLKVLAASGNQINSIAPNVFRDTGKLEQLHLSYNNLSSLHNSVFRGLENLRKLYLSHNKLNFKKGSEHFINLISLQELYLRNNSLTTVPSALDRLVHLKIVDLRNNNIKVIYPRPDVSAGVRYYLGNNKIEEINMLYIRATISLIEAQNPRTIFQPPQSKSTYDFGIAPVNCDCKIYDFVMFLRRYLNNDGVNVRFATSKMTCISPEMMKNKKIAEIDVHDLTCNLIDQCPNHCDCHYISYLDTIEVNCTAGLKAMPNHLPPNTGILRVENASLTQENLVGLQSGAYENITHLLLSHNNISTFPYEYLPRRLKYLDLSFNHLERMPSWLPEYSENHKVNYSLGNNLWACNCDTIAFKRWLVQNNKRVTDITNVTCNRNYSFGGVVPKLIYQVNDSSLCPQDSNPIESVMAYVVIPTVSLCVLTLSLLLCFYKRYQIKFYFFRHNIFMFLFKDDDNIEGKKFDAFISYSSHDSDFVSNELVPKLEKTEPNYTLCIHERNFEPGTDIIMNILAATALSRRTVVVLSNNYLQSDWGLLEFKCAHQKMLEGHGNQIIIVMLDDIDDSLLSEHKNLQLCLSTKTYLKRNECHFWAKLRHFLPKKPLQIPNENKNEPNLVLTDYKLQQKLKPKLKEINNKIKEKNKIKLTGDEIIDRKNALNKRNEEGILNPVFTNDKKQQSNESTV